MVSLTAKTVDKVEYRYPCWEIKLSSGQMNCPSTLPGINNYCAQSKPFAVHRFKCELKMGPNRGMDGSPNVLLWSPFIFSACCNHNLLPVVYGPAERPHLLPLWQIVLCQIRAPLFTHYGPLCSSFVRHRNRRPYRGHGEWQDKCRFNLIPVKEFITNENG